MNAPEVLLQTNDLSRFDAAANVWLLRHINLTLLAGQRLAVCGPIGSGKTLLLRALALLDPCTGTLLWKGQPVHGDGVPAYRKQVIYLHQRPALFEGSVEDNLRLPLALRSQQGAIFQPERILGWLGKLGRNETFLRKRHDDLSGGEAQLVALLRALQLDPTILLLDEATASLDADTERRIESLLLGWQNESAGRTLVWVSHDEEQRARVAQDCIYIAHGQLVSAP